MTLEELIAKLKGMHDSAPEGEKTTIIHLFGILYADELENCGVSKTAAAKHVAEHAIKRKSYWSEIDKGVRLARYVELKAQHQGEF